MIEEFAFRQPRERRGRIGEHDAAGAIQVPGEDIEEIASPTGERAEFLHAGAEASVACRGRCSGEFTCEAANRRGIDAAIVRDRFWCEPARDVSHRIDAIYEIADGPEADQVLLEQRMNHCEEESRVGGGTNEVMGDRK